MLVAAVRRTVDVGLALAGALQETLLVEADHDRHHGRVGELASLREVFDDVAHRRGAALPEARHDLGLEGSEELLLGLLWSAQTAKVGPAHAPIIPRAVPARRRAAAAGVDGGAGRGDPPGHARARREARPRGARRGAGRAARAGSRAARRRR